MLRLRAHAKINLALRVGAAGGDGFHSLATVFQTLSLCDVLYARPADRVDEAPRRHEAEAVVEVLGQDGSREDPVPRTGLVLRLVRRADLEVDLARGAQALDQERMRRHRGNIARPGRLTSSAAPVSTDETGAPDAGAADNPALDDG